MRPSAPPLEEVYFEDVPQRQKTMKSRHLGVTPDELGQLVDKVGKAAAAVRKELRLRKVDVLTVRF